MSLPDMSSHGHDSMDECVQALSQVHAFLHHELLEADATVIRHHLHACERCMENFEIESTISEMIQRCQPTSSAPSTLAARIHTLRISRRG
ncbi:zf-HC2 domain-containing protein [Tessaracoccus defluvii]|uniref:Mycothiol system anti-sigma-R factor n=1 Tax=Tessaracoccus defluvii TaxID=1285901 RepID=A0A7H0H7Z0_9ACTN|nr:zf-HC2 domain-containing protein [Tessaracoccus defluvii]QNP56656.1 mycothiol system anti-sigma-R factor [Tessaracoccus defluvii]